MRKKEGPRYSVVIPCYNEEDYLENTLRSLRAQETSVAYEIIVVDNNCTDATVSIARKYGSRVVFEAEPGVCAARQAGTEAAIGEIIISTDADTTFSANWLENIDTEFKMDPGLVAVCGPCRFNDTPWWGKVYTPFLFGSSYIYYLITGHPFYITATNIAFKKKAWKGYDILLLQGGDELKLLRQLKREGRVKFSLKNSVYTSGRRLQRGMLYNIFVTFLYFYLAGYFINLVSGRRIIGSPPVIRNAYHTKFFSRLASGPVTLIVLGLVLGLVKRKIMIGFVSDNISDFTSLVGRLF